MLVLHLLLILWDLATGQHRRIRVRPLREVTSVAISADDRVVLSGSDDGAVCIGDVISGQCMTTLLGHTGRVTSVAISGDGVTVLSGSTDKTVRVWNTISRQCLRIFEGHTDGVTSIAISADGRVVLSGSKDRTMRVWDMVSGECLRTLEGHTDEVTSVAISSDGQVVLSRSKDKTICVWSLEWEYDFPLATDWDDRAQPYLENFIKLHIPSDQNNPNWIGFPDWEEKEFEQLLIELGYRGFGWLRPEGVRKRLEDMRVNEWMNFLPQPKIGQVYKIESQWMHIFVHLLKESLRIVLMIAFTAVFLLVFLLTIIIARVKWVIDILMLMKHRLGTPKH